MNSITRKIFYILSGLFGGCAFSAYAAAAHIDQYYQVFAPIFLGNSLALLILSIFVAKDVFFAKIIGYGIIISVFLFVGNIFLNYYMGFKLFPYATPLGGIIMIISWFLIGFLAFQKKI